MSHLIIGAGSFLGEAYFDYLKTKNIKVSGISEYKSKKGIINSSYKCNEVKEIINQVMPENIYDFKTFLVSSNPENFDNNFTKMINATDNIVKAYEESGIKKVNINLISTKLLVSMKDNDHPYLKIKSHQEEKYREIKENNILIHQVPNVLGFGDLNFTRLIPFCLGNYVLGQKINLNSSQESKREYIFMDDFIESLNTSIFQNKNSIILTNNQVIKLINQSLSHFDKQPLEISWNNANYLDTFGDVTLESSKINYENLNEKFNEIIKWYLINSEEVKNNYKLYK